jgi:2Fe-2S ferredoxin
MPKVTFVSDSGEVRVADGAVGDSVMRTALNNAVGGIVGECGGVLSCATCHVFVDPVDLDRLEPMSDLEDEMLDGTVVDRRPESRLSCQIALTENLGDLRVTTPEAQE